MRKFFIWLAIIVAATVVADVVFGFFSNRYIRSHVLPGDYESVDHTLRSTNEEIIVLGSSVSLNSVNTSTLEDSLGKTAFNGGANGQDFPFYLTMLKAVVSGPSCPSQVLLGVADYNLVDSGQGVRYNLLVPYYNHNLADIDERLEERTAAEPYFLKSNFYRFNRIWLRILLYHFVSAGIKGENGFVAKQIPPIFPERLIVTRNQPMSAERERQMIEFARICRDKNIDLIVFIPPRFEGNSVPVRVIEQLEEMGRKEGFTVWNDLAMKPFYSDSTLFYDNSHININGSVIYTDSVISRLRNR